MYGCNTRSAQKLMTTNDEEHTNIYFCFKIGCFISERALDAWTATSNWTPYYLVGVKKDDRQLVNA